MSATTDFVTVLTHSSLPLAKRWQPDGTVTPYGEGKHFKTQERPLDNIADLSALLSKLEKAPRSCVIRGKYRGEAFSKATEPEHKPGLALRRLGVHDDAPHHWLLIDVDNFVPIGADPVLEPIAAIAEYIGTLPEAFRSASYHWQLSNSAGLPKNRGKLKAHLWFWSETPYTSGRLKAWAEAYEIEIDKSLFSAVQPHYTAAPIFATGVVDPVPARSGFVAGATDSVPLLIPTDLPAPKQLASKAERLTGIAQSDPVAQHLYDISAVKSVRTDGGLNIECPRSAEHTGESGETTSVYYLAHTNGHAAPAFHCKHEHCQNVPQQAFLDACGYVHDVSADFDIVPEDEPHPAPDAKQSAWSLPAAIGADEWGAARSTPTCVVEHLLFADVATLVAPGGMGKTTLILFKAVHIALGRPLFGLAVCTPGPVLILTSEDSRELLVARLRHICQEMFLTDDELATVRERVRISDLSGGSFKLTEVVRDVVRTTKAVKAIADAALALAPVWLVIDPAVSFGVGESRVNDAEQGLIEAARYLRNHLPGCCVEYVHHTGKTNGRDKTIDQYSGRGGSAFADGSRMVMVLQSLTAKEWLQDVGENLEPGCSGLVLARAKLSYCPPQGLIYLRRRGYVFEVVAANSGPVADERQEQADKVWQFLVDELACGRRYSKSNVETVYKDISQKALRSALVFLEADGRLEERDRPKGDRPGNAKTYVHPVEGSLAVENSELDIDQILINADGPDLD